MLNDLLADTLQSMLEAELEDELGYSKEDILIVSVDGLKAAEKSNQAQIYFSH